MRVSVVLTTYNRASVLARTIEEILKQTLTDFELIVSDDCSVDATTEVVRAYEKRDSRVRYGVTSGTWACPETSTRVSPRRGGIRRESS